jgi:hypothetical protein
LAGAGAERKKTVLSEIGECEFIFMQLNVRESGENPERLRHCNGLQTPINHWTAYAVREGRSEVQARSQNTGLNAHVAAATRDQLLRKEKDEARLCRSCGLGFPECLHFPNLRGLKVLFFVAAG